MPESYMVQLTLRSADDGGPVGRQLLQAVAEEVLHWATGAEGLPEGSEFPHRGAWTSARLGTYDVVGRADEDLEWWEIEWVRPDAERDALWVSQIQLATKGKDVEGRIRVTGRAQPGKITPKIISVRRPNVVPRLVTRFHATYYGDRVDAMPVSPISAQRVGRLVERLEDPERRLPLVLISVPREASKPLVVPEYAADQLAGLAEVALLQDESASWQLTERVGKPLSCFWGAVRLYWPGFMLKTDDPYSHRLWLSRRIEMQGPHGVVDQIFNMLCSRVARATGDMTLWKEVRDGIVARTEAETRRRLQELGADSELLALAEEEIEAAILARERSDKLEEELKEAQQRIGKLEEELEAQREQWTQFQAYSTSRVGEAEESPTVESILGAVETARQLPNIRVLDSAVDSARRSQSNRGPDLYKVFCELDRLAVAYRGGLGTGVKEWLREQLPSVPHEYASDLSDTTTGKREQTYTFGGIFMPKHLKFGGGFNTQNLLRVHFEFEFDDDPPRCVIGHVGEHLPNEMS